MCFIQYIHANTAQTCDYLRYVLIDLALSFISLYLGPSGPTVTRKMWCSVSAGSKGMCHPPLLYSHCIPGSVHRASSCATSMSAHIKALYYKHSNTAGSTLPLWPHHDDHENSIHSCHGLTFNQWGFSIKCWFSNKREFVFSIAYSSPFFPRLYIHLIPTGLLKLFEEYDMTAVFLPKNEITMSTVIFKWISSFWG